MLLSVLTRHEKQQRDGETWHCFRQQRYRCVRATGTGYGIRDTGYGIRDTGYGIRDTGYGIRDTGYEIRGAGYGLRDTD